jgi:hypothetical protein
MSSNTLVEEYYDNGTICERYHTNEQGQYYGLYQNWYLNGQLREQSEWINDLRYGILQRWDDYGQLKYFGWFNNGDYVIEVCMFYSPIEIWIHQSRVNIESSAFLAHVMSDFD